MRLRTRTRANATLASAAHQFHAPEPTPPPPRPPRPMPPVVLHAPDGSGLELVLHDPIAVRIAASMPYFAGWFAASGKGEA